MYAPLPDRIYEPRPYDLHGLHGISDRTLDAHVHLYEGYVKETNTLTAQIRDILESGRADQDEMFYSFESFTVPSEVHVASIKTGKTELHARPALSVRPEDFVVEQAFYRSRGSSSTVFATRPTSISALRRPLFDWKAALHWKWRRSWESGVSTSGKATIMPTS